MNLYNLKKRLYYSLFAQNRHDIHSPFVFHFIETVLRSKSTTFRQRLEGYFAGDMLVFIVADQLPAYFSEGIQDTTILVVTDIYHSAQQYETWKGYAQKNNVPLSMEANGYGFLCFRKDFVVKQHFVVK